MKKLILSLAIACLAVPGSALAQNAYITNFDTNNVTVIDTSTATVTATVGVGAAPTCERTL